MGHKLLNKYLVLFDTGGLIYIAVELLWRGRSHWTMFLLGGACFVAIGLINEGFLRGMPLWQQALAGAGIITVLEFLTGCLVNLWLGWQVWDYSHIPGNILGQVCPQYVLLWLPVAAAGILLDDWLRYCWFQEPWPKYRIF